MITINKVSLPLPKSIVLKVLAAVPIYVLAVAIIVGVLAVVLALGVYSLVLLGIDELGRWGWGKLKDRVAKSTLWADFVALFKRKK